MAERITRASLVDTARFPPCAHSCNVVVCARRSELACGMMCSSASACGRLRSAMREFHGHETNRARVAPNAARELASFTGKFDADFRESHRLRRSPVGKKKRSPGESRLDDTPQRAFPAGPAFRGGASTRAGRSAREGRVDGRGVSDFLSRRDALQPARALRADDAGDEPTRSFDTARLRAKRPRPPLWCGRWTAGLAAAAPQP